MGKRKYLTKEQSQDLIYLGVHQDKASFVSWKQTHNWDTKVIEDKKYDRYLTDSGISPDMIVKYGFAFEGKEVLIGRG